MCPGNNESAGKKKSGRTSKGNKYLRRIFCEIAQGAGRTESYFQKKLHNLKARRGYKRAIVAVGHKVLICVYHILTKLEPYKDISVDYEALLAKKNASRWIKKINELNKKLNDLKKLSNSGPKESAPKKVAKKRSKSKA
jgi:hypothetical protein